MHLKIHIEPDYIAPNEPKFLQFLWEIMFPCMLNLLSLPVVVLALTKLMPAIQAVKFEEPISLLVMIHYSLAYSL